MTQAVNIPGCFARIDEYWKPRLIAELNGQHVRLAKLKGEFVWHRHVDEDELFYVVNGKMTIELRDASIELAPGDLFVVPRGVEHKPVALEETHVMLFEPASTVNTGEHQNERTVDSVEPI